MNKPALALGILCIALAGIDVKLLSDLRAVRQSGVASAAPDANAPGSARAESSGAAGAAQSEQISTTNGDSSPGAAGLAATLAQYAAAQARRSPYQMAADADFLHMVEDPRRRLQLIEEIALDIRRRFRGAERVLGIESTRLRMLSERLAKAEVDSRERTLRCAGDLPCLKDALTAGLAEEKSRTTREVLGDAKAEEFQKFEATLNERRAVENLQLRLRGTPLAPDRADALILALADESTRIKQDWTKGGGGTSGFGMPNLGMLFYPMTATSPSQQLAAAREYSQRMRERAAGFLTVEQRAEFDAMQDDLLDRFVRWRR